MADERIEIDFDSPPENVPRPSNRIVITSEDVQFDPPPSPQTPSGYPMQGALPYSAKPGKAGGASIAKNNIVQPMLAGLIGAALAWAMCEPFQHDGVVERPLMLYLGDMIFFGITGGLIGCFIGAAEGLMSGAYEKAGRGGGIGFAIGAVGGAVGGIVGEFAFQLISSLAKDMSAMILARTIGWSLVGLFIGLGQGVGRGSGKRVVNGLIGGLIGGALAGSTFDLISSPFSSGAASRAVSLCLLGVASGAAIGLVNEVRKQAWLTVTAGQLTGKQFILYDLRTRIGSSQKCEITLIRDPSVLPEHAVIESQGNAYVLRGLQGPVLLNGAPTVHARLVGGSVIQVGATPLLFEEKRVG